jgi:DNA gyrase/topoisomerase IV subunit A
VQAVLPVREYAEAASCSSPRSNGTVKKTPLTEFAFRLARGKIAINLDEGDALVGVGLTDGSATSCCSPPTARPCASPKTSALDGPYRDRRARHQDAGRRKWSA